VLINNAGVMQVDAAGCRIDDAQMVSTITTNLMGPDPHDIDGHRASEDEAGRCRL
jgi:NAD(P)-dependent dehydrogenase (short-subunit alcohol dehydrogenase family)